MARKMNDLTGQKFGKLTVIERAENTKSGKIRWKCKCECGKECVVGSSNLKQGITNSCGCLKEVGAKKRIKNDLAGQKFGRLTAIEYVGDGKGLWKCECECGRVKNISRYNLISGQTKSCGCYSSELTTKRNYEKWENEDYKQKMSDARKNAMEKQWQDEDFRQKMSELGRKRTGELAAHYKPELTEEDRTKRRLVPGYVEWEQTVKYNANWTCDCCQTKNKGMCSHHLDGYNWCKEKRTDVSNGVCLCSECHNEFHKIYGKGNNTKEQYIEFKRIKLEEKRK